MRWPEDEIGAEIAVVCEWAGVELRGRELHRCEDEHDEDKQQIWPGPCAEELVFVVSVIF